MPPGNPESINCVPLTYKVSTIRGVLAHNEVHVGDVTWTYSPRSGEVVGAIVLAVPYHYDARICLIGNTDWSVVCTWDHKWITDAGLVRADEMTPASPRSWSARTGTRPSTSSKTRDARTRSASPPRPARGPRSPTKTPGRSDGNSGGAGLIGWTPPSAMEQYGGTCKAAGIGNNSTAVDMENQEKAMLKWMKANGWPPPQSSFPQTLAGAMQAASSASAAYKRPQVPGSDVHSEYITEAWDALATGGTLAKGGMAWVGERGPELIQVSQDSTVHDAATYIRMASSSMAQPAQGPWSSSGTNGAGYSYSDMHPLPAAAAMVTVCRYMCVRGSGHQRADRQRLIEHDHHRQQRRGRGADVHRAAASELAKINMASAIGAGVNS